MGFRSTGGGLSGTGLLTGPPSESIDIGDDARQGISDRVSLVDHQHPFPAPAAAPPAVSAAGGPGASSQPARRDHGHGHTSAMHLAGGHADLSPSLGGIAFRQATGPIAAAATADVVVPIAPALPDANYTAEPSVEEASAGNTLEVLKIVSRAANQIVIRVRNNDALTARDGTLHVLIRHDTQNPAIPSYVTSGTAQTVTGRKTIKNRVDVSVDNAAQPFSFISNTEQPAGGSRNDLFVTAYNFDGGSVGSEPKYAENWESRWGPGNPKLAPDGLPYGWLERHGNYESLDRAVNYRPWSWFIDLETHEASWEYRLKRWTVYGRLSDTALLSLFTDTEQVIIRSPNGANPFIVAGGPGNISISLNPDQAVFATSAQEATAVVPTKNGVGWWSQGRYWDGAASVVANSSFQTFVTGNDAFSGVLTVGVGGRVVLTNKGRFGIGVDPSGPSDGASFLIAAQSTAGAVAVGRFRGAQDTQTGPMLLMEDYYSNPLFSFTAAGVPQWRAAGIQQTTVGAPGGASAPPATPTKYLQVRDAGGALLVIPAYAAA